MMPGMDGIETVAKIREAGNTIPVIALTANYISNGEEYYTSRGFDGYLPKPVDGETLEKTIRQFLPNNVVMDIDEADAPLREMELPEEYSWIEDVDGISVEEGIVYSGGAEGFLGALKMFVETLEENAAVIEKAYNDKDIKFYTVKVHALKSSARIVGASELSDLAKQLEDAGKINDVEFIESHNDKLLSDYKAFKDKLSGILVDEIEALLLSLLAIGDLRRIKDQRYILITTANLPE
jgi:HPt (histidine-containing phosphotransfer) domain-containing protein